MKKELQDQLYEKYPKIFRQKDLSIQESCMPWGFDVEDGWFDLINNLCQFLQFHTDHNDYPQAEATQVKSKYGSLCFSATYHGGDRSFDYLQGAIDLAENLSQYLCEECGNPGSNKTVGNNPYGWVYTMCDPCWEKHQQKKGIPHASTDG